MKRTILIISSKEAKLLRDHGIEAREYALRVIQDRQEVEHYECLGWDLTNSCLMLLTREDYFIDSDGLSIEELLLIPQEARIDYLTALRAV